MDRKQSHIDLALEQTFAAGFDDIQLPHWALPDFNFSAIDTRCQFLDFQLAAPVMIASMTGGTAESAMINRNLAEAAHECGIALGVGSQRISVEEKNDQGISKHLRKWAGNAPLFGNVGLANLIQWADRNCLNRLAEQIGANAMIIHLNPMQEIFQDNGDTDWQGSIACLYESIEHCELPVIVKEVGMGITPEVARICQQAGASAIDVAGSGGTSFIAIEGALTKDARKQEAAKIFADWGYSTVQLLQLLQKQPVELPIIASGGIRSGLDIAKCLALGASVTSIAGAILAAARHSTADCISVIEQLKYELAIACWGTGCKNIAELKRVLL
ncbi:type 2 isopentenyl-diphosphate Delta-isomerase [Aliidiomarina iranensis]|nr:type 2 isopentenyl-diphosphate Delta-isomerase [Aliidiomarina iranensis]